MLTLNITLSETSLSIEERLIIEKSLEVYVKRHYASILKLVLFYLIKLRLQKQKDISYQLVLGKRTVQKYLDESTCDGALFK